MFGRKKLVCPKCGKKSLVLKKYEKDIYTCLTKGCNFEGKIEGIEKKKKK